MTRNAIWGTIVAAVGTLLAISQVIMTAPAAVAATAASNVRPDSIRAALHIVVSPTVRVRTFVKYYTVRKGDTLSGISKLVFGSAEKWPWLYGANEKMIGVDPNVIQPGQEIKEVLASSPKYGAAVASVNRARHVAAQARQLTANRDKYDGHHGACGDGDGDGMDAPCSEIFPHQQVSQAPIHNAGNVDNTVVSTAGSSGFRACVIARESGGNSQVMNSSGHYGLYQFSESTWEAYGGSAGSFGHASVAEQNRVFNNAMAQGGQSNWSPYDGC